MTSDISRPSSVARREFMKGVICFSLGALSKIELGTSLIEVPQRLRQAYSAHLRTHPIFDWKKCVIDPTNIDVHDTRQRYRISARDTLAGHAFTSDASIGFLEEDPNLESRLRDVLTHNHVLSVGGPFSQAMTRLSLGYTPDGRTTFAKEAPPLFYELENTPDCVIENYGDDPIEIPNFYVRSHSSDRIAFIPETAPLTTTIGGTFRAVKRLVSAYAILAIRPNPMNPDYHHAMITGTHGASLVALAHALSRDKIRDEIRALMAKHEAFQFICKVPVTIQSDYSYSSGGAIDVADCFEWHPARIDPATAWARLTQMLYSKPA